MESRNTIDHYREWYAQDAAAEANDNNDYFRRNHK